MCCTWPRPRCWQARGSGACPPFSYSSSSAPSYPTSSPSHEVPAPPPPLGHYVVVSSYKCVVFRCLSVQQQLRPQGSQPRSRHSCRYRHAERWRICTVSRSPTFGDFVTIRTERSMQDGRHGCKQTTEYKSTDSPLPPLLNVITAWESLCGQSKYPCATLKRRGSHG